MQGKIALEEHFAINDTLMDSKGFFPDDVWAEVRERVLDIHGRRVRLMDEFGIEMMILSLNAPAIQAIPDAKKANDMARKANDYLADAVRKQPDRFQAIAALPLQDPDLAKFAGRVSDSGEGRWTIKAAIDEAVPAPVLTTALYARFSSRGQADFQNKVLSAMRYGFGGHLEKSDK